MPIFQTITNAELAAWRDPDATLEDTEPSDPDQQRCIYHPHEARVPTSARIISRWQMLGGSCRACAEQILAYLHGDEPDDVDRQVVITAAKLSAGMAKTLQEWDEPATVTELRPRQEPESG